MAERKTHAYDPNYSTSTALVEIRTLLSRARTALEVLDGNPEFTVLDGAWGRERIEPDTIPHPDIDEMKAAVREFVGKAARWERRGSKKDA